MLHNKEEKNKSVVNGVMLNAYPDSIGTALTDALTMLRRKELKDVFSYFYILPTFFNSDLDRGFSIIDYNINQALVAPSDLDTIQDLGLQLKCDIVLNHLSVASPQFKDMVAKGDDSDFKDFFINWNEFWTGHGVENEEGILVPYKENLEKLFMRKSGLPILKIMFPDGSERPYWNTFYQKTSYQKINEADLQDLEIEAHGASIIVNIVNDAIDLKADINQLDFGIWHHLKAHVIKIVQSKRSYLGQMDVNAKSPKVWEYYSEVLSKLASYGCKIVRLDAFAYLHKEVGSSNFFNKPGTWQYLNQINSIAKGNDLLLLPEIHAEYGVHLHDEVAEQGYMIYDFFLPGLVLHAIEKQTNKALIKWAKEVVQKSFQTVNMLGCHDGIPLLDLKGKMVNGVYNEGLLSDEEIEEIMNLVLSRGGKVKNLFGADGKKISYYQVNATYFSALGEDPRKLLLARAIQIFMPGIPQVWYLDLFGGKNDYEAVARAGNDGHKEINRATLTMDDIENAMQTDLVQEQLKLLKLRNTHKAFNGAMEIIESVEDQLIIQWKNEDCSVKLIADLKNWEYKIEDF